MEIAETTDSRADEHARLLVQVQERQVLLERLAAIQRLIVDRRPIDEILLAVVVAVAELTAADVAVVRVRDPADLDKTTITAAIGCDPVRLALGQEHGLGSGQAAAALARDQVVLCEGPIEELERDFAAAGLGSAAYAPIHRAAKPVAVLCIAATAGRAWDGREEPILRSFAEHATLAMNHAEALEEAAFEAFHDALTGLPNRVLLMDRLARAISRADRLESDVGVFAIDIDGFAELNDSHGHGLGDELLTAVGARLRATLRPSDTVARLSGDLFAVLAEDLTNHAEVETLARRIADALKAPFELGDSETSIGVSIGSATTGASAAERIRNAEIALRRAKDEGRGRHAVYEPEMHGVLAEQRRLEAEMRLGLARGEFALAYQPIFELANNRIRGLEALLRWNHPTRGELAPGQFIPLAERTGLITELGAFVIERACRQIALWRARYPAHTDLYVSINLSVAQLRDQRLVDQIESALRDSQLDASVVRFEITESMLMGDAEESLQLLDRIKAIGVSLAIDDFGTGFSSLRYLQRLPVDVLKIDGYFVAAIGQGEGAEEIIRAIAELAHAFSLEVVAEGISSPEQRRWLVELGCEVGQGYEFSRPLSVESADAFLLSSGLIGEQSTRLAGDRGGELPDPASEPRRASGARGAAGARGPLDPPAPG